MSQPRCGRRRFLQSSLGFSLAAAGLLRRGAAQEAPPGAAEQIERSRRAALDVLRPSPRDLEHGLRLHADSVVFDVYGFAPRAAVDGDALRKAMLEGASTLELQDLREEMTMTRYVADAAERAEFQKAWEAAGVTCIFQNAGEEGQDPLRLLKRLARFTYVTDLMPQFIRKAVVPGDVLAAKRGGRHCLYFSGNGVPLTQQWLTVEDELRYVRVFFQLGIRMMHLTYNRRNMIGDGCAEPANAGLSDFGRAVVAEMNRVGVIADVAHSGWQTSLEAARRSQRPMVASHTACDGLHHHIRNKPTEVMKAIADTGGLIGICCIPAFLGGSGDIAALLDHIDYAAQRVGVEHVAIGTDVAYRSSQSAAQRRKLPPGAKTRKAFRSLWPSDAFDVKASNPQSLAWTNWPLFTVGLVQRGYPDEDIRKIIGGNMLRVCGAVLPEGARKRKPAAKRKASER